MKKIRKTIAAAAACMLALPGMAQTEAMDKFVGDLMSRMTLQEKIGQLNLQVAGDITTGQAQDTQVAGIIKAGGMGGVFNLKGVEKISELQKIAVEQSRLGIPLLVGMDVIHGYETIFPIPFAMSCSWDMQAVEEAARIAAKEASADGINWFFSPMVDICVDARWGRISEGNGEDPYLGSQIARAMIRGYQGDYSSRENVMACLKHFVGYGASEAGRDYVYTEISHQTLWDTYLPPYEAGVRAGAQTVMSSFNDISGTPGSCNAYTLTEVLKERWGLDGFVVSDWDAVAQIVAQGGAADRKEAARRAFNAGVDMDMTDRCYEHHLARLVREGKVSMDRVNDAVRRVLRVKFRLGLFDRPYTDETPQAERLLLPESRAVAERLAEEAIVLLKNEHGLLPLAADGSRPDIAVMGPLLGADSELLGNWSAHGRTSEVYPLRKALEEEFAGKAELHFVEGCPFDGQDRSAFMAARKAAKRADVVVLLMGERRKWSGENCVRAAVELPAIQEALIAEVKKAGKPVVLVLANGRPLGLERVEPLCDAIVEMWQPGLPGGRPVAGVLSGRVNPSGRLCVTFPRSTGQIPIYYNRRKSARPTLGKYQDIPSTPLYGFGHGLSYTTFAYGDLRLSADSIGPEGKLTAEITVTNTGKRDGAEVVQWFVSDPFCRITRPERELKHFEKQMLRAGECRTFSFEISPMRDLSFVDDDGRRFVENGEFFVIVNGKKARFVVSDSPSPFEPLSH